VAFQRSMTASASARAASASPASAILRASRADAFVVPFAPKPLGAVERLSKPSYLSSHVEASSAGGIRRACPAGRARQASGRGRVGA
jgi:hypothetical protein